MNPRNAFHITRYLLAVSLVAAIRLQAAPATKEVKFLLHPTRPTSAPAPQAIVAAGGRLLASYGQGHAVAVPSVARDAVMHRFAALGLEARELEEVIHTPRRTIQPGDIAPAASARFGLFVLQYVAPATPEWQATIRESGVVTVETLPERAIIVVASREQIAALARLPWIQYSGPYVPDYKFAPMGADTGEFTIQIADTPLTADAIADIERRVGGLTYRSSYANQLVARIRTDLDTARTLLNEPFVLGVETYIRPEPSDERQAWSLTGATSLTGANYLNWLSGYGITPNGLTGSGIVVDIADTGIDEGCGASSANTRFHADLAGRVVYHNGTTGSSSNPKFKANTPHGTIVAGIVAGNPVAGKNTATPVPADTMGFNIKDSDGYGQFYYGLGVAPGVRVGSTLMMAGGQTGAVAQWTTLAVTQRCNTPADPCPAVPSGPLCRATVQNHSNNEYEPTGTNAGYYTSSAREFDISVRNADRASMTPLAVTVSSGNIGQMINDPTIMVLAPATAKNVISVGATESIRQSNATTSACLSDNSQGNSPELRNLAEGYSRLAYASRRGTADNRIKPDLLAPATLAFGPRMWSAINNYYCAKGGDPAKEYYQQYHGTSGTSFAAPVAAGSIALLRYRYGISPSPAMYKAMLIAGARSINGGSDRYTGVTLTPWPSAQQGFGLMGLDQLFTTSVARSWRDSMSILTQSQTVYYQLTVAAPSQPVKIVAAWTDAPGAIQNPGDPNLRSLVNDLDLVASLPEGFTYYGNFLSTASTGYSLVPGGCGRPTCPSPADTRNNVEVLQIDPARFTNTANRIFTVRVTAANLNGIGVPGASGGANNQDFALFAVNGTLQQCGTEVICGP